jgi:hypothetical protein
MVAEVVPGSEAHSTGWSADTAATHLDFQTLALRGPHTFMGSRRWRGLLERALNVLVREAAFTVTESRKLRQSIRRAKLAGDVKVAHALAREGTTTVPAGQAMSASLASAIAEMCPADPAEEYGNERIATVLTLLCAIERQSARAASLPKEESRAAPSHRTLKRRRQRQGQGQRGIPIPVRIVKPARPRMSLHKFVPKPQPAGGALITTAASPSRWVQACARTCGPSHAVAERAEDLLDAPIPVTRIPVTRSRSSARMSPWSHRSQVPRAHTRATHTKQAPDVTHKDKNSDKFASAKVPKHLKTKIKRLRRWRNPKHREIWPAF